MVGVCWLLIEININLIANHPVMPCCTIIHKITPEYIFKRAVRFQADGRTKEPVDGKF